MRKRLRGLCSFSCVQKQIADTISTEGCKVSRHPNTKHPTAKRAACSSGRTVSDEIQQLQTTTRHLISPREISSDESRIPQCSISSYGRAIAETQNTNHCRTKNEPRARPDGQYLMKFNNCKLQPGISFPRAKLREMRAENLNAVFPHMGGKPQKYRTAPLC